MEGEIELRKKFLLISNGHLEKATTWLLLINQNDLSWYEHLLFSLCSGRTPLQGLAVLFHWIVLFTPSQLTVITYQSPRNNRKTKLRSEMMELERLLSRLPTYVRCAWPVILTVMGKLSFLEQDVRGKMFLFLKSFLNLRPPSCYYFLNFLLVREDSVNWTYSCLQESSWKLEEHHFLPTKCCHIKRKCVKAWI